MVDSLLGKMLKLMGLLLILGWGYSALTFAMKPWWWPTFWCSLGGVVTAGLLTVIWAVWYEDAQAELRGKPRNQVRGRPISMGVGLLAVICTAFLVAIGMWGARIEDYYAAFWFMVFAMVPGVGGAFVWSRFDVSNIKAVVSGPTSSQS